jgi:hypothetical protein
MCAAKKKGSSASGPVWIGGLFAWLLGAGRPVLMAAVLVGVFAGGSYLAWVKLKAKILSSPEYHVGPEQVEITPLPDWIHSDIRAEVFCNPTLDGPLSIMDDGLVGRIAKAFEGHPWVARVGRVSKHHPALVKVEIVYRQPVCMIEMPGKAWAVDAEGVVLPSEDFTLVEATQCYPHVVGIDRPPAVPPGRPWQDLKVIGGAEIAAVLAPVWDAMRLYRIVPRADAAGSAGSVPSRRSTEPQFTLLTHSGTQIHWGYAPRANVPGELPAAEKVALLRQYWAQHDTFDGPQGQRQELDIRQLGRGAPTR